MRGMQWYNCYFNCIKYNIYIFFVVLVRQVLLELRVKLKHTRQGRFQRITAVEWFEEERKSKEGMLNTELSVTNSWLEEWMECSSTLRNKFCKKWRAWNEDDFIRTTGFIFFFLLLLIVLNVQFKVNWLIYIYWMRNFLIEYNLFY